MEYLGEFDNNILIYYDLVGLSYIVNFFFLKASHRAKVAIAVIVLLAACSSVNKKPPKESDGEGDKINVQIIVAPDANLNTLGQPAPIRLDIYQLSSRGEFEQLGFFDLIEKPGVMLGEKLIQRNQYILYPDTVTVLPTRFDSNLQYLGVVGGYRNLDDRQWRLTLLKQERRWYQFGGNYLYIYVGSKGLSQLSRTEMREKLEEYQRNHPEDKTIRNGRAYPDRNNMDKGIFRDINMNKLPN